jgi:hypothetical protein
METKTLKDWRIKNGLIYLSLMSEGLNSHEWVDRLDSKDIYMTDKAIADIMYAGFKPTIYQNFEVVLIPGKLLNLISDDLAIYKQAREMGFQKATVEVAFMLADYLSSDILKKMGLKDVLIMHEPICDFKGNKKLFAVSLSSKREGCFLGSYYQDSTWPNYFSFAFMLSTN